MWPFVRFGTVAVRSGGFSPDAIPISRWTPATMTSKKAPTPLIAFFSQSRTILWQLTQLRVNCK